MTKQFGIFSQQTIQLGLDAFRQQDFEQAYRILSTQEHPVALNAAGVSAQRLARHADAYDCFKQATALAPRDANIFNNWGHFELGRGDVNAAREKFDLALQFSPGLPAARIGLAQSDMVEKNWEQAKRSWSELLASNPSSRVSAYGLASALLEMGQTHEAIRGFESLQSAGRRPEIAFMLGRGLLELGEFDRAENELLYAHDQSPSDLTLRTLASLYWMTGRRNEFDRILSKCPEALVPDKIKLLLEADLVVEAEQVWLDASTRLERSSNGQVLRSIIEQKLDHTPSALEAARVATELDTSNDAAWEALIISELRSGSPERALEALKPLRTKKPLAQNWIAYEADAERLIAGVSASRLVDPDPWIQTFELPVPDEFKTIEEFNFSFSRYLISKHTLDRRPLEQSLRGGTQTTRSLLADESDVVKAYLRALDQPIRDYLRSIGSGDEHPTSARNRGEYSFSGMWSVRLTEQGYHESHIHPEGWISSAYYVKIPQHAIDSKAGWIFFGRPPYPTKPEIEPIKWVKPEAGMLVLFPSFMWHGTVPIDGSFERITAPFDLLPK